MQRLVYLLFFSWSLLTNLAWAQDSVPQLAKWMTLDSNMHVNRLLQVAWENPAVKQLECSYNHSSVGASIAINDQNNQANRPALDAQRGDYSLVWSLGAQTYMKHKNSTLWGHARYDNGSVHNIVWNETSDIDVVYPYFLADSVYSTRLKLERYSFGGGYATVSNGFYWGTSISYMAGLYYRSTDPRPRNVTSDLSISVGVGHHIFAHYLLATSIYFKKYKQTNNIAFYSELGHDKIFHLVGLSNDYGRFAGTGESSYYNGYQWGGVINLHPINSHGISATVNASRLSFNNILTSLNKLPLAHVTHAAIKSEIAWLANCWGIRATLGASRRVGTENVFGDAASAVYPEIGSNAMYHENRFNVGIDADWSRLWIQNFKTELHPFISYNHLNEIYADPQCRRLINIVEWGSRLNAQWQMHRWKPQLSLGLALDHPTDGQLMINGVKDELTSLQAIIEAKQNYLTHFHWRANALLSLRYAIGTHQALRLMGGSQIAFYQQGLKTFEHQLSLAFLF